MHCAFLTTEYPPLRTGGIGTSIQSLAHALVELGHRVSVIGWGAEARFEDRGVEVNLLGETSIPRMGWLLNRRRAAKEIRRLVSEDGLEIVEAPDWCGPSAGLRTLCPIVVRCNGSDAYFARLEGRRSRPSVRKAESMALRTAHSIAAVSTFTAEETRKIFSLSGPIEILPNGVSTAAFSQVAEIVPEEPTLLYLGTLVRKKGVLDLPAILRQVRTRIPQARLVLAGSDAPDRRTGRKSTRALIEESLDIADRDAVEFLGAVPNAEVPALLAGASACLFPSYAEAFPVAWLEAMAAARPIVAYDIGWAQEVLSPEREGALVPPGDTSAFGGAAAALLASPDRARATGRAARQRVESNFTAELNARRTAAWYGRLLSQA